MKNPRHCDFSRGTLGHAVELALFAMFAAVPGWAAAQEAAAPTGPEQKTEPSALAVAKAANREGDAKSLTCPENFFEVGVLDVSRTEPKFGEYNGLSHGGGYGVGNFSYGGGDGYCQRGGNTRWQVYGNNLATTSRSFGASYGQQGQWAVGFNYDQLRHYTTTGYQTPYQGGGGNVLSLPANFGVVNTGVNGGTRTLTPTQLAAFQDTNVYNTRQNYNFNAFYALTSEWDVKFNYKHIEQSGSKLIGGATDVYDMSGLGGFSFSGQSPSLKMYPQKDTTDNISLSANWVGEKAYASFEYYGSLYHDDYRGVSFSNPYVTGAPATGDLAPGGLPYTTMSTPPSNILNQLSVTGGYLFSKQTRLTGGLSFGLNTQNSSYDGTYTTTPNTAPGLPASSLHGRVINTHADARLTHEFSKALSLNTGFRYDERDNHTPVNTYSFVTIGGAAASPTNAPESYRHTVADAALDYRIDKKQRLRFGYKYDHMQRWCNSDLANNAQGAGSAAYYVTPGCMQVPRSTDNSLNLGYKLSLTDVLRVDTDYTYSDRDATINPSFYNPMQSFNQGYENYGWLAYFQAPRREHALKVRTLWQATDALDFGLTGRYTFDNYTDSTLGVQTGHSGSINLDASYRVSDNASYGAYVSWQRSSRYLLSASDRNPLAPPTQLWDNTLSDTDLGIGLNGKQKFLHDKFQLSEDLSYNFGRTWYGTGLVQNIAAATGNSGQVSPIRSRTIQFRLVGSYQFSKNARLNVGYMIQRVMSNDYFYNGYATGYTPSTMLPANLRSPNYTVNVVYVTYRYSF